jgi:uncharacterized protein (TIGR02300 family)
LARPANHTSQHKEAPDVARATWGAKRTCPTCSARFYDLGRTPIVCPKCGGTFEPEAFTKSRRSRASAASAAAAKLAKGARAAVPKPGPKEVEIEPVAAELGEGQEDEAEEDVIEDTSELGEDEDVVEVVEGVEEEEER